MVEQLSPGVQVDLSSITNGGIYDPGTRTIRWILLNASPVDGLSYRLTTEDARQPNVLGHAVSLEDGLVGTNSFGSQDGRLSSLLLQNQELSQRPTMEELIDARPGSNIRPVIEDGKVTLQVTMETSEDLQNWFPSGDPLEIEVPLPGDKRFFRFGLE